MATFKVLKPFKTPRHRFPVGAVIAEADIDGPLSAEQWADLGHIELIVPDDEPRASAPPSAA